MSLPKKPRTRVYVVVRYDPAAVDPRQQFTAEEVVESVDIADAEVARLNGLCTGTGIRYFSQTARLHRPSTAIGDVAPKVPAIDVVLTQLRERLGPTAFDVVDHWPADPYAIAVSARDESSRLAYLSAYEKRAGRYDVHLERVPNGAAGVSYADVGYFTDLDVDGLTAVVASHLTGRAPEASGRDAPRAAIRGRPGGHGGRPGDRPPPRGEPRPGPG
jgi:hypothetical protein